VPRLWEQSVDEHRRAVREAILDTTAALAVERGVRSVTMSHVAQSVGIGRATLYKYFGDVEAILLAWHQRQVAAHTRQLHDLAQDGRPPVERLEAVLGELAAIYFEHHGSELAALLHHGPHIAQAEQRLNATLHALIGEAVDDDAVRDDVPVDELVAYITHALGAASTLPSRNAVRRLVATTMTGIRRPSPTSPRAHPA
jgi:AcrR family transcriptional regulator